MYTPCILSTKDVFYSVPSVLAYSIYVLHYSAHHPVYPTYIFHNQAYIITYVPSKKSTWRSITMYSITYRVLENSSKLMLKQ